MTHRISPGDYLEYRLPIHGDYTPTRNELINAWESAIRAEGYTPDKEPRITKITRTTTREESRLGTEPYRQLGTSVEVEYLVSGAVR